MEQHTDARSVIVAVDETDYDFEVKTHHHEGNTEYIATPGEDADAVRLLIPHEVRLTYQHGEITYDDRITAEPAKALQYDIWRAIKEQLIEDNGPHL